jgi:hypothetical protein
MVVSKRLMDSLSFVIGPFPPLVMPGLVPGIHVFAPKKDVDGRDEPGHDGLLTPPA